MGFGLTISKMIIKQLGGDISVTSQTEVGSKFSFSIPIEKYEIANTHHNSINNEYIEEEEKH